MSVNLGHKQYIVRLKDGVPSGEHFTRLGQLESPPAFTVVHTFAPDFLNAYVATFSDTHLPIFQSHGDLLRVEEDTGNTMDAVIDEGTVSWELARINRADPVSSTDTKYLCTKTFSKQGKTSTFISLIRESNWTTPSLGAEPGRLTSTTVVCRAIPKVMEPMLPASLAELHTELQRHAANLYEVKVLNDSDDTPKLQCMRGMEWLATHAKFPAVANMSFSGEYNKSENEAVEALINLGIHVVVCNRRKPTVRRPANYSPASTEAAITVGLTNKSDEMGIRSNYGKAVDVFAPGAAIISCGIASTTDTATKWGTSQAAPFVAGIIATLISLDQAKTLRLDADRTEICAKMKVLINELSIKNVLSKLGT
ncbi:peptidase S8/S53 domain-containing protein [Mycena metata]|uniref:Peptidase S8/S53 domain-containing protein n=1 Tax=Mycena metata TaxID=1033252 RepID=A0AAD7DWT0_9AGAR|nr:peptidase S8/S53 domain-containing protein [Mycena metata]